MNEVGIKVSGRPILVLTCFIFNMPVIYLKTFSPLDNVIAAMTYYSARFVNTVVLCLVSGVTILILLLLHIPHAIVFAVLIED